ncbi:MAG: polysaccharide biosynthesis C-terminal domain-containing protein [Bacteroidetes bacterium]|nr:polysaccharide biosynthesis C-terminal domain-containing protein [Bacteroidota bacterium]
MGIIQRQALRNTIINFAGAVLGGIVRMLTPLVVPSNSEVGLMSLLDSISGLFVTLFSMGYNQILVKLFPKYRNEEGGHHGFLLLGIMLSIIGIGISATIFYFFGDYLPNSNTDMALFKKFGFLIFPMIFFRIIFLNVDSYAKMLYNTFIGVFLDTFLSKVFIAVSLVLYVLTLISFDYFIYFYALSFCIPGVLVMLFAFIRTKKIVMPSRELRAPAERKKIYGYILFGMLMGASGSIVVYVDQLMISNMMSFEMVGIYTILFFAARFILIPSNGIIRIAQVVISEAWERDDRKTISEVYEKSCVNLMLIAVFLLGLGWTVIQPVFSLHPKYADYIPHSYIFLILGIGIAVEMATGVNAAIIASSKHYRYNMYFNVVLAVLVIALNYVLISHYQLIGAAIASVISMTVVNFGRWLLLFRAYNLQPFNLNFLKALILCIAYLFFTFFLDYEAHPFVKIALNTILLSIVFWGAVVLLKLSVDINKWLLKMRTKFF